jgi:hypothetical protein
MSGRAEGMALSFRGSGGADVPRANAALIVSHIPMTESLSQHWKSARARGSSLVGVRERDEVSNL